jgi:7-cyano-7-deazaguanine synthase in queuosine biosynthesis
MPTNEHLVLCSGASAKPRGNETLLTLNLHGASKNVRLEIGDISRRLLANLSDVHTDLLDIVGYIYAADSAISRAGKTDSHLGAMWRRKFRFVIPVRQPSLWSSKPVTASLVETISFLSDDDYEFEFCPLKSPPPVESYFPLSGAKDAKFMPDEVILFSGGLDSFAGTVEELVAHGTKVALVSHRSASKITEAQNYLIGQLRRRFGADRVLHVPVRANLKNGLGKEPTHRARSFLFAAIGAVTGHLLDRQRMFFFENGVVSLNLPPVGQVVGARATRTTHPQALAGFRRILSAVLGQSFDVSNPYAWITKSEVIERIVQSDCADLIKYTRSCTRVHAMTNLHPHCGKCSQCIDRRFAILAAGQDQKDPDEAYKVDLLLDGREPGPDREMALAYIRSASKIGQMTDVQFFAHFGETSRIVSHFAEPAGTVARRIFELHRRHAAAVCRVFDAGVDANKADIRNGSLPPDCLVSLVAGQRSEATSYPAPPSAPKMPEAQVQEIRMSINDVGKRVVFSRWGEIKGISAELLIALAAPFREAREGELAPEKYPYLNKEKLARQLNYESDEVLRRRVLRCRKTINKLAIKAGDPELPIDAVIENSQWHGYRLNPDRVRLVGATIVRQRSAQFEDMSGFGGIVLQKSFCTDDQKF